jgi:tartrate-resistant acid phosphatase type 5
MAAATSNTATRPVSASPTRTARPVTDTARPTVTLNPLATPTTLPTPSATPAVLSFAAVGDYGWYGPAAREVAALVDAQDPDLVITLGDNNYPHGAALTIEENITANYGRFIAEGRFFPALGNHDLTIDNGQAYFDYFELPGNERYYDFVRGEVHFFVVNSDWREPDGIRPNSAQAAWLEEGLRGSAADWQVVYFHASPFVSYQAWQVPVMDWPFADWGADLVLSGHAHLYERLEVNGLTYIINGLGGYTIYPFDKVAHPASQARYNGDFGALFVEVGGGAISGRFITRGGETVDNWSITMPNAPQ